MSSSLMHTDDNGLSSIADFWTLLKPGVMLLVVFTGALGVFLAPGGLHPLLACVVIACIAMGSGAGAAINMWYDRDIDQIMERTKKRPIPSGRVDADDALWLGIVLAVMSVMLLGLATNWLAAGMLAFAIWFYAFYYTMVLKRTTPNNIVIGGAAGAFPPVIGWWAVQPDVLAVEPWVYMLIVFLWTPPHFWALALYRHKDYALANIPMLPVVAGEEATKRQIIVYSWLMVGVSLVPALYAAAPELYSLGALLLGAKFLVGAHRTARSDEPKVAMRLFGYSILYLFVLFGWRMLCALPALSLGVL